MRGNLKLQIAIDTIQKVAKAKGLSNDDITNLLDVAASARFSDAVNSKLIKFMLPNTRLSQQIIINCISWICTNTPSPEIQALLCRWMVLVFDVIDAKDKIHSLYGVIFNFIESDLLKSKRRKQEVIPSLSSSSWGQDSGSFNVLISETTKVPISQITTFDELLVNLDRLELPSQIAAVLQSPFLQHAVSCTRDENIVQRLSFWLYQTLHEELLDCDDAGNNPRAEHLLQLLINFTEFLQEDVPVSESFLVKYLYVWNGLDYRPYILRLITRFRVHPFQRLNDLLLEPLRKLFFCSSVYFKCQLIYCLTELLRHYLEVELPKHRAAYTRRKVGGGGDATDEHLEMNCDSMFEEVLDPELAVDTIQQLIVFVDDISCVALQQENDHTLLLYHVFSFYELVSVIFRTYSIPFVSVPTPGIVYRAMLSNNAVALCRLCKVVCNYKEEFNTMKTLEHSSLKGNLKEGIKILNQYIIDISNALWRNMSFQGTSKTMIFDIPIDILERSHVRHINVIFSIQHHMALSGYSYNFLKETQADEKYHPIQIKGNIRIVYLQFLSNEGLNGIVEFINTFIKRGSSTSQKQ
ncbi:centromere protein I-like [Anneissia japonica]|uniref:centromere protein I-like n=1 Tax=Anneissia japonica TaxID=1529436 RepID=UPI001425ACEA|nr:centromere protein I-like [Anneissia japonica]